WRTSHRRSPTPATAWSACTCTPSTRWPRPPSGGSRRPVSSPDGRSMAGRWTTHEGDEQMAQTTTTPGNLQIARGAALQPIEDVASGMGLGPHLLEHYGRGVAKIDLAAIEEVADRPPAKYVVVS